MSRLQTIKSRYSYTTSQAKLELINAHTFQCSKRHTIHPKYIETHKCLHSDLTFVRAICEGCHDTLCPECNETIVCSDCLNLTKHNYD